MRLFLLLAVAVAAWGQNPPPANREIGSKACAVCHASIAQKYALTGMARTSGRTAGDAFGENLSHASFSDSASGANYRVERTSSGLRLDFSREAAGVTGNRLLEWFIGSGSVGRSYLFADEGYLFQAPVSYYAAPGTWGLSPGYQGKRSITLTRAVEPSCLQCHATGIQPVAGTQNGYQAQPFREAGIGCERCHGPGGNHAARRRSGDIVNPARLDPARRDSVCAQCHLTGAARVATKRRTEAAFRAGDLLSDHVSVFTWSGAAGAGVSATSHYEKLQQSACKLGSGGKLWCGSCHDPHEQPAAARRTAYYRERCLTCHQTNTCNEDPGLRKQAGDDCTSCHMPKGGARTVEHVVFTDHAIPRRPGNASKPALSAPSLTPFFPVQPAPRDLALAYAIAAMTEPAVRRQAFDLLQKAAALDPRDVPVLSQLAQFYDRMGQEERAMELCERIIALDPAHTAAAVNLAIYRIKRGRTEEAVALWNSALRRNPALSSARINLAVAQYRSGNRAEAEATLRQALRYEPDLEAARKLLQEVRSGGQ